MWRISDMWRILDFLLYTGLVTEHFLFPFNETLNTTAVLKEGQQWKDTNPSDRV